VWYERTRRVVQAIRQLALARLRLVLEAAGTTPASVALLPGRSSSILGTAAATLLGLPDTGEELRRLTDTVAAAGAGERDGWLGGAREARVTVTRTGSAR
jgi:hypothetical protein